MVSLATTPHVPSYTTCTVHGIAYLMMLMLYTGLIIAFPLWYLTLQHVCLCCRLELMSS